MIEKAIAQARQMPYVQGERRVFSIVVDKKGKVLGQGSNSYTKSHPIQAHYAELVGLEDKIFLHAEMAAMVRCRGGEPHKIYIARVDSEGEPMYAAPCPICSMAIKAAGIVSVEYTT